MPLEIVKKLKRHITEKNIIIGMLFATLIVFIVGSFNILELIKERQLYENFESINEIAMSRNIAMTEFDTEIEMSIVAFNELKVLKSSSVKTYMDYTAITSKVSKQWDMIYNQKLFKITIDGYLMTDDGYYAVALGRYFGGLGSKYIMVLDTGIEIPVCKLDAKADIHTDSNNFYATNAGDIIEFIIDGTKMDYARENNGYIYGGNFNKCELFNGNVVKIIVIDKK